MRQVNLKKYVLPNLPYLFEGLYATKLGQAWRLSSGTEFADKVLHAAGQLSRFPESGVLRSETLMGRYGFRALFLDHYVLIYKVQGNTVYIYHFKDARKNYIYQIFGLEE